VTDGSAASVGPGSVLWRAAGDGRSLLTGTAAGILQLLHPGLGAGVEQHSAFFADPWGRILRSIPQIWGTIFAEGEEAEVRGRAIRDLHTGIKGADAEGRRYHALDPDVFWWAHATFTWEFLRAGELFLPRPPSAARQEQLYAETVTWYRRYGVSARAVPRDLASFRAEFRRICAEVLEPTAVALRAIELAQTAEAPTLVVDGLPRLLRPAAPLVLRPTGQAMRLLTLGALPPVVRRRFDVAWSRLDAVRFRALVSAIRESGRVLPRRAFDLLVPPDTRPVLADAA
jgi:uncharacterized protein (DUF2236 family)